MPKPLFEFCSSYGEDIRVFRSPADLTNAASVDGDLDCNLPFIVQDTGLQEKCLGDIAVKTAIESFRASWPTSSVRANPGRGLLRFKDPAVSNTLRLILAGVMKKFLFRVPEDASDLVQCMISSIFAVAVGNEAGYVEQQAVPTLRLALQGSRVVAMCSVATAAKVCNVSMDNASCFTKLAQAFLGATQNKVENMGKNLFFATLGPGDLLYTPMSWVVAESAGLGGGGPRVSSKDVVCIVCFQTVSQAVHNICTFFSLLKSFMHCGLRSSGCAAECCSTTAWKKLWKL
jgi:hypothetical protein